MYTYKKGKEGKPPRKWSVKSESRAEDCAMIKLDIYRLSTPLNCWQERIVYKTVRTTIFIRNVVITDLYCFHLKSNEKYQLYEFISFVKC
jgi:hypothetical protein